MKRFRRALVALLMPPRPNAVSGRHAWAFALIPVFLAVGVTGAMLALGVQPQQVAWSWTALLALHPVWLAYTVQRAAKYFFAVTLPVQFVAGAALWPTAPTAAIPIWIGSALFGLLLTSVFTAFELLWDWRRSLGD